MGQRRKVLLVDDSEIVAAVVTFTLSSLGCEVTTIDDPHGLAAALERETPDVVLIDAGFPNVDRPKLVELVSPHTKSCVFVVFSDRAPAELAELVTQLGATSAIPKDATADGLKTALAPYLDLT